MSTKEATPRPWALTRLGDNLYVEAAERFICDLQRKDAPKSELSHIEADAELIVTAVNAHDALVALARAILDRETMDYQDLPILQEQARQALKLAGENT